jgi:radical SAM protein with 4Fe4S-binding SPASM domain
LTGAIEVTHRCPLKCVHCYNNLPLNHEEARHRELTYLEHCRIVDEITEAGCLWLLYTGGEIFVRKDFLKIYTYAKEKGLLITLFTNGILIDEQIANYLADWRPFSIEITLYGRTRETYEGITGVSGSFERCMRAIHLLRNRDLPLKLKTMAITLNKHEVWDMKRFVEGELGLPFKFDAMINARLDCSRTPLTVRLAPEEIVELDLRDERRAAEWREFAREFTAPVYGSGHSEELYYCGAGVNSFGIDPSGVLRICGLCCDHGYDLREGSFSDGWEQFILEVRKRKVTRHTKCLTCKIKAMCGMCPANSGLENRDAESPVDFLCRVAHLRAYALRLPIPPHGDCEYCEGGEGYAEMMRCAEELQTGSGKRLSAVCTGA